MVNKKFENIKKKSRIFIKCVPILGLLLGQKADKLFFVQSQFYRCTDFHATYKLASAGLAISNIAGYKSEASRVAHDTSPIFKVCEEARRVEKRHLKFLKLKLGNLKIK